MPLTLNQLPRDWRDRLGFAARPLVGKKDPIVHRTLQFLALIVFAFIGVLLARHMGAYAGSSDTSGYMNDARLLASWDLHPAQRVIEGVPPQALPYMGYIPLGFLPLDNGRMYPTYPIGLPVFLLAGSKACGPIAGPNVVMWLHAMACLWIVLLLFKELGLGPGLSLLGVVLLGSSCLFTFMSVQAMSDMPATLWAALAVLASLKARDKSAWAILAGFSFGCGILVRPTGVLMALPLVVLFPWNLKRGVLLCLGGLPVAAFMAVMNKLLYGHLATTGYGGLSSLFGTRYIAPTLQNYLHSVPIELTPLVLLALAFPFVGNGLRWQIRLGLCLWILVFFCFYAVYFCTHESWWYLRFVLPTYPALIACVLFTLKRLGGLWPPLRTPAWILLLAFVALWNRHWIGELGALDVGLGEKVYPETCSFLREHVPQNSVILCMQESGAILYYTKNVIVRWDCITRENLPMLVESCRKTGRGVYMVLFPFEEADALKKFDLVHWRQMAKLRNASVWMLADSQ